MKVRIIAVILVVIAGLAAAFYAIEKSRSKQLEYDKYIASAVENAEKDIPYIAVQKYRAAFAIRNDDESVYQDYLEQCRKLGDTFYTAAVKQYPQLFPSSPMAYQTLCQMYYEENNYSKLLSSIAAARAAGAATEIIRDYYYDVGFRFQYLNKGFTEAWSYLGNTALVQLGDYYGYLNSDGSYLIAPIYTGASQFINGTAAVNEGDGWYMINGGGFKVAVPDAEVSAMSFLNDGRIRVYFARGYNYIGTDMHVPDTPAFDYAGNFKNGIAAVKKGEKWAIISADGKMLCDYIYDDILLDEYETCVGSGILFLKKDGRYRMYDTGLNPIGSGSFTDARPFVSGGDAAVCVDGLWGFVDTQGNITKQPQYEDARSYSANGLAAVRQDGVWSYINPSGEVMVEGEFEDCKPFSANGIAAVKEGGVWNYIELYATYYSR